MRLLVGVTNAFVNSKNDIDELKVLKTINWDKLFDLSVRQRVFNLVYKYFREYIPDSKKMKFTCMHKFNVIKSRIIIENISQIFENFRKYGLNALLMKGATLSYLIHDDPYIRKYGDINILVNEKDILEISRILNKLGFFPKVHGQGTKLAPIPYFQDSLAHDIQFIKQYKIYVISKYTFFMKPSLYIINILIYFKSA